MKRKVFIISQSDRIKEHTDVKKILYTNGIPCSIVSVSDNEHEKMINKLGRHILFIEENYLDPFFNLRKLLFRNNVDFFSFGRFVPESINAAYGNLDIGFNKEFVNRKIKTLSLPSEPLVNIAVDIPPDSIPYRYLRYFKSPFLLSRNLISLLSDSERRHKPVIILAPVRPYNGNSSIPDILNYLKKRGTITSDISKIEKGSTVLTWSTKRFMLLLSMGLRPVPITRCLAATALYSRKDSFKDIIIRNCKSENRSLFNMLEATKLEKNIRFLYKLLEW